MQGQQTSQQIFRSSFWTIWSRLSLVGPAVVLPIIAISLIASGDRTYRAFTYDFFFLTVIFETVLLLLSAISVWMHVYYFTIIIDADGIKANTHKALSKRHHLAWADLSIRRAHYFILPCYQLRSKSQPLTIIIPKLKDSANFEAALKQHSIVFEDESNRSDNIQPTSARVRARLKKTDGEMPVREGGYIIVSTEQRADKSR